MALCRIVRLVTYGLSVSIGGLVIVHLALMMIWSRPEQAVARFYSYEGERFEAAIAEDEWADPLILTGRGAVPAMLTSVTNREMPRRHYGIWYLGLSGDTRALPVLEQILADGTESEFARGDALTAIAMIDEPHGRHLALRYESHETMAVIQRMGQASYLAGCADEILYLHLDLRRSYFDAFRGRIGVEWRL